MTVPRKFTCSICGSPATGTGANPFPLDARPGALACDACDEYVTVARIALVKIVEAARTGCDVDAIFTRDGLDFHRTYS